MKIAVFTDHMPTHGAGGIKDYCIRLGKYIIRFWSGGYGNIRPPLGCWRWYPSYTYYRKIALHLHWFKYGITINNYEFHMVNTGKLIWKNYKEN